MAYFDVDKVAENAPTSQVAPEPGYGHVPEYQVSSLPWVTSSVLNTGATVNFSLPKVSSFIHLINHGTAGQFIRLGFTQNGVESTNFVKVDGTKDLRLDVRVKEVFIRSDGAGSPSFSFAAGLTMIPSRFAPTLTGSVSSSSGQWNGVG